MSTDDKPLSPNQARFVSEYVVDNNATQAAIRAGYSAKTADVQGPRLLGNVRVAAAIEEARVKLQVRTGITQDRVLRELELLAFSDVLHYTVDDDGNFSVNPDAPKGASRAVSSVKRKVRFFTDKDGGSTKEVETEFRLWDKPGSLKLAGRHVGLFAEDKATETPQPLAINVYTGMRPPPELATAQDSTLPKATE